MGLLTIILLSSCSKLGFSKEAKFYSSLKPNSNEGQENQNNQNNNDVKRNVGYVIGEKQNSNLNLEKSKEKSDILIDNLEAKSLLEIQAEEQKMYQKEHVKVKGKFNIDVDYSECKNLLDILKKEQEAIQKFEKEFKIREDNTSSDDESLQYGFEKTIGANDFFC